MSKAISSFALLQGQFKFEHLDYGCSWTNDTLLTRESISGNDWADLQTENNTEDQSRAENITSLQTEISEQRPLWANVDSPTEPRHVALLRAITSCQLDKHRPINQNCTPALLSESSRERTRVTFFGVVAIASGRCNKSIKTIQLIDVAIGWAPL